MTTSLTPSADRAQRLSRAAKRAARTRNRLYGHRLSLRQRDLLTYIASYIRRHGFAPTQPEMQRALRHRSNGYVTVLLNQLEERNLIERDHGKVRGVRLGPQAATFLTGSRETSVDHRSAA